MNEDLESIVGQIAAIGVRAVEVHLDGTQDADDTFVGDTAKRLLDAAMDDLPVLRTMQESERDSLTDLVVDLGEMLVMRIRLKRRPSEYTGPMPRGFRMGTTGNLVPDPLFGRSIG